MYFRFAQIAPDASSAFGDKAFGDVPKPFFAFWLENVHKARVTKIKIIFEGFARLVGIAG